MDIACRQGGGVAARRRHRVGKYHGISGFRIVEKMIFEVIWSAQASASSHLFGGYENSRIDGARQINASAQIYLPLLRSI